MSKEKMSIEEALYVIDGILRCEQEPVYVNMLHTCKDALIEKYQNDEMTRKAEAWPHCAECGTPYKFSKWNEDVRKLSKDCECEGTHIMKKRPANARYEVII